MHPAEDENGQQVLRQSFCITVFFRGDGKLLVWTEQAGGNLGSLRYLASIRIHIKVYFQQRAPSNDAARRAESIEQSPPS